jgi:hypothetical protein
MKNHLIILIAYKHFDIVKSSLDSIIGYKNADVFVVENKSENSIELENYFITKDLVGYIQFETNIANSAITIFIRDFWDLISQYDYVTITDGDLFIADINETFKEIIDAFKNPEIIVSSVDLWQGNSYLNEVRLSEKEYLEDSLVNQRDFGGIEGITGAFLITIQNKHLEAIRGYLFVDSHLANKVNEMQGRWFKTNKNLAYHLTWDLYYEGNEYFEWKKQVFDKIWFVEKYCNYKIIKYGK